MSRPLTGATEEHHLDSSYIKPFSSLTSHFLLCKCYIESAAYILCVFRTADIRVAFFLRPLPHLLLHVSNKLQLLHSSIIQSAHLFVSVGARGVAHSNTPFLFALSLFSEDMDEQNKLLSRPIFRRDVNWEPFPNWTEPSRIFAQDFGLPPFLEPGDIDWLDWAKKRLASFSWPRYTQSPLLPPFTGQQHGEQDKEKFRQLVSGVSEIQTGQNSWKINLDVNHFTPEEITVSTKDGYLQISGMVNCSS